MQDKLQAANQYVQEHALSVDQTYLPAYHAAPPLNWINDPNGFCFFRGEYHLFCQYHPYAPVWGPMHWGHWTSTDLLNWQWRGVALAPDQTYDAEGCFSGHALAVGDRLYAMYTGVSRAEDGRTMQQQCLAVSEDGYRFEKCAHNPVIATKDLPAGASEIDFRDPKLLAGPDGFRALVASKGEAGGQLLMFTSDDLIHWTFERAPVIGVGDMLECPDSFQLDGREMLIACVMSMKLDGLRYPNAQPAVYAVDDRADADQPLAFEALDFGFDNYAPQTAQAPDGRRILLGWMNAWSHDFPPRFLGHGWNGAMTLPRELSLRDGRLIQRPIRELARHRKNERALAGNAPSGSCARIGEMLWRIRPNGARLCEIRLMAGESEYFLVQYDADRQVLRIDRSHMGHPMGPDGAPEAKPYAEAALPLREGEISLRVFSDACSLEIFANDGEAVLTSLVFPTGTVDRFSAHSSDANARFDVRVWDLDMGGGTDG